MSVTAHQQADRLFNQIDLKKGERLYAVLDAAQDDGKLVFTAEETLGLRVRMLFRGTASKYMQHVAPYFVVIDSEIEFLTLWLSSGVANAGVLLTSKATPENLLRHLCKIFVTHDEDGQEYFFRFYDPRVLLAFVPTCTTEQSQLFYGPVSSFICESQTPGTFCKGILAKGSQTPTFTLL